MLKTEFSPIYALFIFHSVYFLFSFNSLHKQYFPLLLYKPEGHFDLFFFIIFILIEFSQLNVQMRFCFSWQKIHLYSFIHNSYSLSLSTHTPPYPLNRKFHSLESANSMIKALQTFPKVFTQAEKILHCFVNTNTDLGQNTILLVLCTVQ